MFNKKLTECKDDRYDLKDKVSELEFELRKVNVEKDWDIKEKVKREVEHSKDDFYAVDLELKTTQKENEMLNKAFDEIGFDVKDSKEMMSELIKALGKKADVKIIK